MVNERTRANDFCVDFYGAIFALIFMGRCVDFHGTLLCFVSMRRLHEMHGMFSVHEMFSFHFVA